MRERATARDHRPTGAILKMRATHRGRMAILDVAKGLAELRAKSLAEIERATAMTWASRAAASYELASQSGGIAERFRQFYEGETYRQEALEHAAMAEDQGKLLIQIHDEVDSYRVRAAAALKLR